MTKENLQKELKEKVKEGIKPSDLKKLKRSKSADDIPSAPPSPADPPIQLLQDQLSEKQKQIEKLREKLEEKQTSSSSLELDNSLFARHQNLKDWFTQYQKSKQLDTELKENIDEASTELINQDDLISKLQDENRKLKLTNQSLSEDLELAHRAVEWRKNPLPNDNETPWLSPAISLFLVIWFISLLNSSWRKYNSNDKQN